MLIPYCAKPSWCDYRYTEDCEECGRCSVGEIYRMARERGMIPLTVTNFEMLRDTLRWCAEMGYTYVGHCCLEFFEKRYEVFKKAQEWGVSGVLIDVKGFTCYDLKAEAKAYRGEFQVELDLSVEETRRLLSLKGKVSKKRRTREKPPPTEPLRDLVRGYRVPRALPGPVEVGVKERSKGTPLDAFSLILEAKRPALVVGPLVLWNWCEESAKRAELVRSLIEHLPNLRVYTIPDYRPKNGASPREMDPMNPHASVLRGGHDLTVFVGVHCYRLDLITRVLKRHTSTKIVTFCDLYTHREAEVSLTGFDAFSEFVKRVEELFTTRVRKIK